MTPVLVLVSGPAGSGKSTMARLIARTYRLPCLDYDTLGQPFLTEIQRRYYPDAPCEDFYRDWRGQSYDTLWGAAMDSLRLGVSVAASAPCKREWGERDFFKRLALRFDTSFQAVSIELMPDQGRLRDQLIARREPRDQGKLQNWASYAAGLQGEAVWDAARRITLREYQKGVLPESARALLDQVFKGT